MKSIAFVFVALLSLSVVAQTRLIPHVTPGTDFETVLVLENTSGSPLTYQLKPFDAAGNALPVVSGELSTSLTASKTDLFGGAAVSHFLVEGEGYSVTAAYRATGADASPAHVVDVTPAATRYRFYAGNWDVVFDGLAVVNSGEQACDVWVAQVLPDGSRVAAVRAVSDLVPMAKQLFVVGGPLSRAFEPIDGASFEVYATQPLAVTALRGTSGADGLLWANGLVSLGKSQTERDELGIWFIENGSLYDAFEAMGYAVANDRLWQLYVYRYLSTGRLAEIFGPSALEADIYTRTTTYSKDEYQEGFDNLDAEAQSVVRAYVAGINRHVAEVNSMPELMPLEAEQLDIAQLESWSVLDVLAWQVTLMRSFDVSGEWFGQLEDAALLQSLSDYYPEEAGAMYEDLRWIVDTKGPTMADGSWSAAKAPTSFDKPSLAKSKVDFISGMRAVKGRHASRIAALENTNAKTKMGSYAWVISGEKSDTGMPILYSGPQMGFSVPSIVTEGSIRIDGLEVSGMTVPGIPGIIIGRTPHHAWAKMTGAGHTLDLYLEDDSVLSSPHRMETIAVRGGNDVEVPIYRSAHGPVVNQDPVVSAKYSHRTYELGAARWLLDMARAESMDEFGTSLEKMGINLHVCYADREGNIAYWMGGRIPRRPEGEWRLPQGAVAEPLEYDLADVYPLIHEANPERGFYGGWNNRPYADYPNAPLGYREVNGAFHSAQIIQDELASHEKLSFEQVRDLAKKISSTLNAAQSGYPWQALREYVVPAIEASGDAALIDGLSLLEAWDGHMVVGGEEAWATGEEVPEAWWLWNVWLEKVLALSFGDELSVLPEDLLEIAIDDALGLNLLLHGLDESTSTPWQFDWFSNRLDPSAPQSADAIFVEAMRQALSDLGPRPWADRWETTPFVHTFLGVVHEMPYRDRSTYAHCVAFDEQGPSRIESMFPLGNSGLVRSDEHGQPVFDENYFSMVPYFDLFTHHPFPLFR